MKWNSSQFHIQTLHKNQSLRVYNIFEHILSTSYFQKHFQAHASLTGGKSSWKWHWITSQASICVLVLSKSQKVRLSDLNKDRAKDKNYSIHQSGICEGMGTVVLFLFCFLLFVCLFSRLFVCLSCPRQSKFTNN